MLERDEPVNLLVMRPQQPPAATPRIPGKASNLEPPVDLKLYIDALPPPHADDPADPSATANSLVGLADDAADTMAA